MTSASADRRTTWWALAIGAALLLTAIAAVSLVDGLNGWYLLENGAVRFICLLWLALLGAAIGSFINVVVYRLPREESIVFPSSHCPACGHAIRPRDNLPVLGWLILSGKCRDCGAPIAARYPFVELLTATMFVAFGYCALCRASLFVYRWIETLDTPPRWYMERGEFNDTWAQYAILMILVCTIWTAGLIRWDGFVVARNLWILALAVPVIMVDFYPLSLVKGFELPLIRGDHWWYGLLLAAAAYLLVPRRGASDPLATTWIAIGLSAGLTTASLVCAVASVLHIIVRQFLTARPTWLLCVLAVLLAWLCTWLEWMPLYWGWSIINPRTPLERLLLWGFAATVTIMCVWLSNRLPRPLLARWRRRD